jgi:hypothetical protein
MLPGEPIALEARPISLAEQAFSLILPANHGGIYPVELLLESVAVLLDRPRLHQGAVPLAQREFGHAQQPPRVFVHVFGRWWQRRRLHLARGQWDRPKDRRSRVESLSLSPHCIEIYRLPFTCLLVRPEERPILGKFSLHDARSGQAAQRLGRDAQMFTDISPRHPSGGDMGTIPFDSNHRVVHLYTFPYM